jgi:hypothetical protein
MRTMPTSRRLESIDIRTNLIRRCFLVNLHCRHDDHRMLTCHVSDEVPSSFVFVVVVDRQNISVRHMSPIVSYRQVRCTSRTMIHIADRADRTVSNQQVSDGYDAMTLPTVCSSFRLCRITFDGKYRRDLCSTIDRHSNVFDDRFSSYPFLVEVSRDISMLRYVRIRRCRRLSTVDACQHRSYPAD